MVVSHPPLSCLFAQLRFGGLDSKPQRPAEIARAAHLQPLLPSFKLPELSLESLTGAAATPLDFSRAKGSLSGRWRKDKKASDSMDEACDIVELPWYLKRAIGFVNDLEIEDNEEHFQTKLKAAGVLDIVETYGWDGGRVQHKRRDKRPGVHEGIVVMTPAGPSIQISWDDPFAGQGSDTFCLQDDGTSLHQQSHVHLTDGRNVSYRTVFHKVR